MTKEIYISYFYQIRFFPKNYVPLSTAVFDPKWFHPHNDKNGIFIHKSGVVYGVRFKNFSPLDIDCDCQKNCPLNPETCRFLKQYREHLNTLNFDEQVKQIYDLAKMYNPTKQKAIPVLIVYETPNNPCSERVPLKEWFSEHNYELKEWHKT